MEKLFHVPPCGSVLSVLMNIPAQEKRLGTSKVLMVGVLNITSKKAAFFIRFLATVL